MKKIASIIVSIALFSCHGSNTSTTAAVSGDPNGTATAAATPPSETSTGNVASTIKVTLTGGENAGSYTATSKETTCSMGLAGEKSFGNQYSIDSKDDKEFSSLQMVATDYDAAKAGTSDFMVTVGFGKIMTSKSYTINGTDGHKDKGSGTLKLTESGKMKTVNIDGTTADGVHIVVTLTCNTVMTANGEQ